jgi:hypothetical protein
MTEHDIESLLTALLEDDGSGQIARVEGYAAAGVLTRDAGIVVHTHDGRQFQVTVLRSR